MRNPHVVALWYRLAANEHITFDNPPPVEYENEAFTMRLADGKITFEMKGHYPSEAAAKVPVEKFLRNWQVDMDLRFGRGQIRFVYEGPEVIDRNPPPPGEPQMVFGAGIASGSSFAHGTLSATWFTYPSPPQGFLASPDVETMWNRYQGYLEDRELLASMGYFCLTVMEQRGGKGRDLSLFRIAREVRDTLGTLTSERGDAISARKAIGMDSPFTKQEVAWIEAAVKVMIRRLGEYDYDPAAASSLPEITMEDLPKL